MNEPMPLNMPFNMLADIELPSQPNWHIEILLIVAIASILLIFIAWKVIKRKASQHTKHSASDATQILNQIIDEHGTNSIGHREAAFRIANVLRLALKLPQLTSQAPEILKHEQLKWSVTIKQLEQLRYEHQCDLQLSPELVQQIRHWIVSYEAIEKYEASV